MECNREEAIRAKGIAETKMENKDFFGARKIIFKAQQLFPDLDNLSQMLTVCDVHCSAATAVNGEVDWYGILQVEPTADESSIKKQYRKLALLLHPDKNKFAGAEGAFKLIGEANMTLSDRGKRSLYDMKRRTIVKTVSSRQASQQPNTAFVNKKQPGVPRSTPNNTSSHFSDIKHQQSFSAQNTFCTLCPSCGMTYQYARALLNRILRCQCCLKSFMASELNVQEVPPSSGANSSHPWNHTGIPKQAVPSQPGCFGNAYSTSFQGGIARGPPSHFPSSSTSFQGGIARGPTPQEHWPGSGLNIDRSTRSTSKVKPGVVGKEDGVYKDVPLEEAKKKEMPVKTSTRNASKKRGRKMAEESSDSYSSESSSDSGDIEEFDQPPGQNEGATSSHYPRRSTRQKQNVSYNEDGIENDDDFVSLKRARNSGSSCNRDCDRAEGGAGVVSSTNGTAVPEKTDNKECGGISHEESLPNGNEQLNKYKMHENGQLAHGKEEESKAGVTSDADSTDNSQNLGSFSYPDPEFYDFEKDREASRFAVDQIWAVYDSFDAMPRFYARIKKVFAPDFKLCFTWLEHNATGEAERAWTKEELPIACGNYRLGKSETTQNRLMFSHLISWEKGLKRNTYDIYPRKGEVWALFKDWHVGWSSDANSHRLYEYEIVEVLSNYAKDTDTTVSHLVKIKGFISLFMRAQNKGIAQIPYADLLRFSHRVPSFQLAGGERGGIPAGSFELDTTSLPSNFEETFPSISLDNAPVGEKKLDGKISESSSNSATGEEKFAASTVNNKVELNENPCETKNKGNRGLSHEGIKEVLHSEYSKVCDNVKIDAENSNAAANPISPPLTPPNPISYEGLPPDFYDFQEDRSLKKFQRGQIWALYSDVDKYPKYYARVKKVDLEELNVHVSWLELCPRRKEEKVWLEKELPSSCGRFRAERETATFTTETFSHQVHAKSSERRDQYDIYPRSGEVWAVYRNWNLGWTRSNLDDCEYDVVEVLEQTGSAFKLLLLTKVDDYNSVFKPEVKGGVESTMVISVDECLRFSHQIPAFRLTEEADRKLWGFWELDSQSVPDILLL